jgi:hypothetical protein
VTYWPYATDSVADPKPDAVFPVKSLAVGAVLVVPAFEAWPVLVVEGVVSDPVVVAIAEEEVGEVFTGDVAEVVSGAAGDDPGVSGTFEVVPLCPVAVGDVVGVAVVDPAGLVDGVEIGDDVVAFVVVWACGDEIGVVAGFDDVAPEIRVTMVGRDVDKAVVPAPEPAVEPRAEESMAGPAETFELLVSVRL